MSYPQYHGWGGPAYHHGHRGEPKANAATAVIAAVLAVLGALIAVLLAVTGIDSMVRGSLSGPPALLIAQLVCLLMVASLLGTGATLLFMRKPRGRDLVIGGAASTIGLFVAMTIARVALGAEDMPIRLMWGIPVSVALVLAAVPSTARWLRQGQHGGFHAPGSRPPGW